MNRIKQLRLERDLSQRGLSEKIGCSQKSVDYWEKGAADPTSRFVCALADCFECSTDYLLGREDDFGNVSIANLSPKQETFLLLLDRLSEENKKKLAEFAQFLLEKQEKI